MNLFHKNFQPDLDVGDLIIWNLRLHHSGASWRYKINKNFSLPPFIDNLMPKFTKIKPQFEKIEQLYLLLSQTVILRTKMCQIILIEN